MNSQELATSLACSFYANGQYTNYNVRTGIGSLSPASACEYQFVQPQAEGFAGLSIQAVGFGDIHDNKIVHIYTTQGSKKVLESIETSIGDIEIKIHKMGKMFVRPELAASSTNRGNLFQKDGRIACGSSCAPSSELISGTLGAIVQDDADVKYFLSNNHVFAGCNHTPVDMPILSPSTMDASPNLPSPREVCRHHSIFELRSGFHPLVPTTKADAAIAKIYDDTVVTSWQGDAVIGYDTPSAVLPGSPGLKVKKIGRTTGITYGEIESLVNTPSPILYKSKNFNATVFISDAWIVRANPGEPFALPGDSGSLVVSEDGAQAVGLLFAASPNGELGWITPIEAVLEHFNVSLVNSHGTQN